MDDGDFEYEADLVVKFERPGWAEAYEDYE